MIAGFALLLFMRASHQDPPADWAGIITGRIQAVNSKILASSSVTIRFPVRTAYVFASGQRKQYFLIRRQGILSRSFLVWATFRYVRPPPCNLTLVPPSTYPRAKQCLS